MIGFVSKLLVDAGWKQADVLRLQKKIPQASNDFYNAANDEVEALARDIKTYIYDANGEEKDVPEFLGDILAALAKTGGSFNPYLQADYLRALGVLVYYEEI